ncbi:MAG: glycoside hydrolase family 127 protein [Clostridia bacterium]|nr:glycoside hydrolase family 127 protein [Clostridia bacterium]
MMMVKDFLASPAIEATFRRFSESDQYKLPYIYQSRTAQSWPGDWVGRTLLAFNHLYELTGREIPAMHEILETLEEQINENGHLGAPFDGTVADEQLITGHLWYVRGLVRYAKNFGSEKAMAIAKRTVENLYLPLLDWFEKYPLERTQKKSGGIDGNRDELLNGWLLSTDIGCGFMCMDGLADYYEATGDPRVRRYLERLIEIFDGVDFVKYGFQTHCTLSCLRAILHFYEITKDSRYFDMTKTKFERYLQHGMTLTYENYNWFGRETSWTEPCAVVDSFMLAKALYRHTGEDRYLTLARRIWFNGLQFCHRPDGGSGSNSCVTTDAPVLFVKSLQNSFCCNMRYAEGLLDFAWDEALFTWDGGAEETVDAYGRHFVDDRLIVLENGEKKPLFSCRDLPGYEGIRDIQLKIIYA